MASSNVRQQVRVVISDIKDSFTKGVEDAGGAVAEDLVEATHGIKEPDSGLARSNWQVGVTRAPNTPLEFEDFGITDPPPYPRGELISQEAAEYIAKDFGNLSFGNSLEWRNNIDEQHAENSLGEVQTIKQVLVHDVKKAIVNALRSRRRR